MTHASVGTQHGMERNATLEREVKFAAPFALALPDLRHLVGGTERLPEEQLVTRYFDTMDRRLWRQGMTLRHRSTGNQDDGTWTLKLPHAPEGQALQRTEVSWPGPSQEIPTDASAILRGVIRRHPLHELTVLETTRQRLVLRDDKARDVAELDDDVVLVVGGPRDGARFRQVELEIRDSKWRGHRVVRRLEKAGARVENDQKLAKAMNLSRLPSPSHTVDEQSTVADVLRASLHAGLDRLVTHDWQLRLRNPDPSVEDVHQARVATRRLRSDLKTFGGVLDPVWLRHVRSDLKWIGTVLGELRDRDVLSDRLSDAPPAVRQRLAVQRRACGGRLEDALGSDRYLNLVDKLQAGSEQLPIAAGAKDEAQRRATDVLPSLVAARWRAVRRQVRRAGPEPSPAELHRVRIKSKQLRYAAEAAVPIIGKPARRTSSAAEDVQTALGEHHDSVAAEAWLRDEWTDDSSSSVAPIVSSAVCLEVGRLVAEARLRQRESEEQWERAWATLRVPKRHRWLPRH